MNRMKNFAVVDNLVEKGYQPGKRPSQYYSAEITIDGLDFPYQFKIWNIASKFMCILVKEKSDILPRLKEGDVLSVKYHPTDSGNPSEYMETKIRHMTKNDHGRLKGHYILDLEILESRNSKKTH